ncbi:MAG TPA: class I SAM-dependent methyltransferase [Blastocatellia bacterium]|nr:class I SAM-dependent methyltransferase [Blastocatellia bacterium]
MRFTSKYKGQGPSREDSFSASPELFNEQAGVFDQRAGLPSDCCREIAKTAVGIGKAGPGDLVVEVGAGTGQIGRWFKPPVRYVGFDLSAGMLEEFRRRLGSDSDHCALLQADANAGWPIADGSARVIFSSRTMHLLNHERIVSEVFRVAAPAGAVFLLGRLERDPLSVRERMASEMNERLQERGFKGRRNQRHNQKLVEACKLRGADVLESICVAKWRVSATPRQSLNSWRQLTGLGGVLVPETIREQILQELESWSVTVFGALDQEFEFEEAYVIRALAIPSAKH